jgi:DNA repair exonuclease SbcCD ATPase subunit
MDPYRIPADPEVTEREAAKLATNLETNLGIVESFAKVSEEIIEKLVRERDDLKHIVEDLAQERHDLQRELRSTKRILEERRTDYDNLLAIFEHEVEPADFQRAFCVFRDGECDRPRAPKSNLCEEHEGLTDWEPSDA